MGCLTSHRPDPFEEMIFRKHAEILLINLNDVEIVGHMLGSVTRAVHSI